MAGAIHIETLRHSSGRYSRLEASVRARYYSPPPDAGRMVGLGSGENPVEEPMTASGSSIAARRQSKTAGAEWEARVQLAACYRIFDMLGWTEMIFNHITLRLPGPERHFLINPFGLWYREVTASNLVKIDIDGNVIGGSEWPVNRAGFVIHSAIHAAREDAHCIMHTHTTAGMAIACQRDGLAPDNFYSALLHGHVAYHDFEGITVYDDEKPRLVRSLGDKSYLILRNHGLLVCGRTVPEAFLCLWTLQRACEVQHAAQATGRPLIALPAEVLARTAKMMRQLEPGEPTDRKRFAALRRRVDAIDQSYRS
jgi:ribulose-5-phosphate 4-epimerase/fuculose-1-phosphate aldolase